MLKSVFALAAGFWLFSLMPASAQSDQRCIEIQRLGREVFNWCDKAVAIQRVVIDDGYGRQSIVIDLRDRDIPLKVNSYILQDSIAYYAGNDRYGVGRASEEQQWAPIVPPGQSLQLFNLPLVAIEQAKLVDDYPY